MRFLVSFLDLPKRDWKSCLPAGKHSLREQGCRVVTAQNDTLFLGLLFSTETPRGLVMTVALLGEEAPVVLLWRSGTLAVPASSSENSKSVLQSRTNSPQGSAAKRVLAC